MKRNIFDNAVIKLTLVYTAILAAICLGFSVAFYVGANNQLSRPVSLRIENNSEQHPSFGPFGNGSFDAIIQQRDNETRTGIVALLIITDTIVLIIGAVSSYFLAKWTLTPIEKMTEQQANFISDASHELRTPLTAISMENEVALRDPNLTKTELTNIIKSNLEETKKLQALTDRLLKLSQKEPLELFVIDVKTSADAAVHRLQNTAKHKSITLKNNVKSHSTISNPDALSDILIIFIENAIKYSPSKSTVTINFKNDALSVSDEGPGISSADLPNIFNRFYRAEKSRTSKGYGLGLSLAQQLAEQLNLKISATNNSKKGCTFSIKPFSKPPVKKV